jgi:hypothetical protein
VPVGKSRGSGRERDSDISVLLEETRTYGGAMAIAVLGM